MRIAVIGVNGQIARALQECGPKHAADIRRIGRPELDLTRPGDMLPKLRALSPDAIVNAAAYTAVDRAESEPDLAEAANARAPGEIAAAAAALGVPFIHLSTDYVFDGQASAPYAEDAAVGPLNVYGRSKLAGERAVAARGSDFVILRLAWLYAPFGRNFMTTMLDKALAADEVRVVADQVGSPTSAPDAADGVLAVARNLVTRRSDATLRGTFHMAAAGYASWADFAEDIFAASSAAGGPRARVRRIATADYPTPARRPANARLDCARLTQAHGMTLPHWRDSVAACVRRALAETRVPAQ